MLDALRAAFGAAWQIDSQLPLALDDASQPEPAVSLVPRDPNAYRDANDCVEIHREPDVSPTAPYGWRYRSVETLRPPAAVRPLVAPGVSIRVADLLP